MSGMSENVSVMWAWLKYVSVGVLCVSECRFEYKCEFGGEVM